MDLDLNSLRFLSFFAVCKESLRIIFSLRKYGACRTSLLFVSALSLEILGFSMLMVCFRFTYEDKKNSMNFSAIILFHLRATWIIYLQAIVGSPDLYLKSMASIVCPAACIFSGKEEILSSNDIIKIIQSVSKRVLTTFLWSVAITVSYTILGGFLAFFCVFFDCFRLVGAVILTFYFMGFVYISSVAHLAQAVSILEDVHGLEAFVRSKSLIRGKLGLASAIFLLGFSSAAIIIFLVFFLYYLGIPLVLSSSLAGALIVVVLSLGLMVVLAMAVLFHLVAGTIVYFVCKSDHDDDDLTKSLLADCLASLFNEGNASSIPSIAEKASIFSFKNPWINLLFSCMLLLMVVIYFFIW